MNSNNSPSHPRGVIDVNQERCKGCGLCIEACPKNLIAFISKSVNSHGYAYVTATDSGICTGCASCGIVCPDGCITVYRTTKTNNPKK